MDPAEQEDLEKQCTAVRAELKSWELKYSASHNGQKPSREAIKNNPEIAAKYKQYNSLRDVLSGKKPKHKSPKTVKPRPAEPQSASPRKRKQQSQPLLVTPSKSRVQHFQTPTRNRIAQPDFLTPTMNRVASPQVPSTIGPTPQRDGRVLGLFDLMSDTEHKSPSKVGFADVSTPQKRKLDDTDDDSIFSRGRTPMSASKRQMLDSFLTPTKRSGAGPGDAIRATPKSISKDFSTPSFLKRRTAPVIFDEEVGLTSPSRPTRLGRPQFTKGLSSLVASLRRVEEEAFEDDEEAMREMEAGEFEDLPSRPVHPSPPKFQRKPLQTLTTSIPGSEEPDQDGSADYEPSVSTVISESVPGLRLLSGFDDAGMYDTDEDESQAMDRGRPMRQFKKRQPKRTTRRVKIRPTLYQRPSNAAGEPGDAEAIPETQPRDAALDAPGSDGEFVDVNDENVPPPRPQARTQAAQSRKKKSKSTAAGADGEDAPTAKKPRKVNELAHANFKRLKLRNHGSKGGPGFNSKFRRRR
ncbi:hypothetical protein BROUX41_006555 [Berkeleyomyces rouxiae]|uniref:uncharacterized protein n=1 Tax=Berkeleyomyces rouxiae TaxID=2035830 RepID=UPI003B7A680D